MLSIVHILQTRKLKRRDLVAILKPKLALSEFLYLKAINDNLRNKISRIWLALFSFCQIYGSCLIFL
jgi:hypothetical protein